MAPSARWGRGMGKGKGFFLALRYGTESHRHLVLNTRFGENSEQLLRSWK